MMKVVREYLVKSIIICLSCIILCVILNNKKENDTILIENNVPRVDCDLILQPLMDAYLKKYTNQQIQVSYTNDAYKRLLNNEVDLIITTYPNEEVNKDLEITKIINDAFIFYVNINNTVDNLSINEIKDIYSSKITNYKEVGGKDVPILAYQRPVNSYNQKSMIELVMKDTPLMEPIKKEYQIDDNKVMLTANYENNLNSIGYSYYYYTKEIYMNDDIKYLAIDKIKPNFETIQDATYPLITSYYIITRKENDNDNINKLKQAILSKGGKELAKELGYVPTK